MIPQEVKKPPLGVTPNNIWLEKRAQELSRAIHEYIEFGDYKDVSEWSCELLEIVEKIYPKRNPLMSKGF